MDSPQAGLKPLDVFMKTDLPAVVFLTTSSLVLLSLPFLR